jgi:hypothetical protein
MYYVQWSRKIYTWVNGVARAVYQAANQQNNGQPWTDLYMGLNGLLTNGDYKLSGYIADILIYDSAGCVVARTDTESYLASKYGITLGV